MISKSEIGSLDVFKTFPFFADKWTSLNPFLKNTEQFLSVIPPPGMIVKCASDSAFSFFNNSNPVTAEGSWPEVKMRSNPKSIKPLRVSIGFSATSKAL